MKRSALQILGAIAAAALASCGSSDAAPSADTAGATSATYLAFGDAFQGFRSWESFKVPADSAAATGVHTSGPRTEYLKSRPAKGSTSFPVGTIIVKQFDDERSDGQIFAMVKRGGDYNAAGASGWEWFELQNASDGTTAILWRGVGPPSGEKYGGDPSGGCNSCHGTARDNDFVRSSAIRLSEL